jgi:hypothetical protein
MTESSAPPNMNQATTGQPGQARPIQQTPQNGGSASAQSSGRSAQVRKPLFRS